MLEGFTHDLLLSIQLSIVGDLGRGGRSSGRRGGVYAGRRVGTLGPASTGTASDDTGLAVSGGPITALGDSLDNLVGLSGMMATGMRLVGDAVVPATVNVGSLSQRRSAEHGGEREDSSGLHTVEEVEDILWVRKT